MPRKSKKYNKQEPKPELHFRFGKETIVLTDEGLLKALKTFRAIRHRLRQDIIEFVYQEGRVSVSDILNYFREDPYLKGRYGNVEQSVISQHLAILKEAGILKQTRESRYNYYELNADKIKEIANYISNIIFGTDEEDTKKRRRRRRR